MKFKYYKEYTIDIGDVFMDNGSCIQFQPKNKDKLPFGSWHKNIVYVSKTEWKRLWKECIFETKRDVYSSWVIYHYFLRER